MTSGLLLTCGALLLAVSSAAQDAPTAPVEPPGIAAPVASEQAPPPTEVTPAAAGNEVAPALPSQDTAPVTAEPAPSASAPPPAATPDQAIAPVEGAAPDEGAVAAEGAVSPEVAAPAEPPKRVVVLSPEFRVFVQSAGGVREIEPDWTTKAQDSLTLAVERHLRHDPRFSVSAPVDPASAEEADLLREHVELFKIVAMNSTMLIRAGGKAWEEKKIQYDYTLGDGLALYADRANADYAFMIGGAQVKQTGGSIFMQLALAGTLGVVMPGGGTYLMLALVDMRTGNIVWFNSLEGGEVFGMTGSDLRDEGTANEIVGKLFDQFPQSKLFNTKIF